MWNKKIGCLKKQQRDFNVDIFIKVVTNINSDNISITA